MKFKLIMSSLSKKLFSQLASTLAIMLVTFFLLVCFCSIGQNLTIYLLANQMQIDKKIIYTTNSDFYLSDAEKKVEENTIASMDMVDTVENIQFYDLIMPSKDGDINLQFICYDTPSLRPIRYSLELGSYPTAGQTNCLLLPYDYMNTFEVGDTVSIYVIDNRLAGTQLEDLPVAEITISGFLSAEPIFSLGSSGTSMGLNDIFVQDSSNYGVIYSLIDQQGNVINPKRSDKFIISAKKGSHIDALKESLTHVVQSPAFLFTGNEAIATYSESHKAEIIQMSGYGITAFALAFSMMLANTLMSLVYRQREMAIYYLTGATWKESVWIIIAKQCIPIILGFALGVLMLTRNIGSSLFYIVVPEFKLHYVLMTFLVEMIMFGCAILPFWIMTQRKSPIELFRKD